MNTPSGHIDVPPQDNFSNFDIESIHSDDQLLSIDIFGFMSGQQAPDFWSGSLNAGVMTHESPSDPKALQGASLFHDFLIDDHDSLVPDLEVRV